MANQLTEEELILSIGDSITSIADLTLDSLIEKLLPGQKPPIPEVLRTFISKEFYRQSKNLCRISAKNFIATSLKNGSSEFIRTFIASKDDDQLIEIFPSDLKVRLKILKFNDSLGSVLVECVRVFNRLREKFSPAQSEDKLRNFLTEWLQSGLMPLSIWKAFEHWKSKGPTLNSLRNMTEPQGAQTDTKWREFKRLLKNVSTDNFVEVKKLHTILDIIFVNPRINLTGGTVKVHGRIMYLSEWVIQIQSYIRIGNAAEIAIYVEDNLGIDCDLTDQIWQGKNLIIVSNCVNIWREAKIRLSGCSFSSEKRKAASSTSTQSKGDDGRDGRPGESSGNLAILATKMINAVRLTVELNGGRGENGEDGGNGCDGLNGVGVTQSDLDRLIVSYSSLYRDSWSNFQNYSPPSNWVKQSDYSSSGDYIFRTYQDENKRLMAYSYAADKGWLYTTYEIFLRISGSNGTSGSLGGSNGVGGKGGYNGILNNIIYYSDFFFHHFTESFFSYKMFTLIVFINLLS